MLEVSKGIHVLYTYYILHYYSRLVKEVTIREFNKQNNLTPPPEVTNEQWKRGRFVTQKCPMRWAKGGIEALCEAAENYLVGLLTDANILASQFNLMTFSWPGELGVTGIGNIWDLKIK